MAVSRDEIAGSLRELISSGVYAEGAKLPSSRELADRYGAARNTANEALRSLALDGLISLRDRSTAVVLAGDGEAESSETRAREAREELKRLRDEMRDTRGQLANLEQRLTDALRKLES